MGIAAFIAKRALAGVVLLVLLSLLVYGLLAISPGSAIQTLVGSRPPSPALLRTLTAEYHLNKPFLVQYWYWLSGLVRLDLGRSISVQPDTSVVNVIVTHLTVTLQLALYSFLIMLVFGIPLGVASGIRRGKVVDRTISFGATVGISAPAFVMSILLLYVFGVALGWFPVYGIGSGFGQRVLHLTLPAFAMAGFLVAILIRQTRAATLTVMQQDYITFARGRGLNPVRVLLRYALRNSAVPVVASAGLLLIVAITADLFVEQVFSLPGVGQLLYTAVLDKDVPVVQGVAMALGAMIVAINLVVDLVSLFIDPRLRVSVRGGA
ncbi:MAG: ABC transporter permease [Acidimicrobiales bacterium]